MWVTKESSCTLKTLHGPQLSHFSRIFLISLSADQSDEGDFLLLGQTDCEVPSDERRWEAPHTKPCWPFAGIYSSRASPLPRCWASKVEAVKLNTTCNQSLLLAARTHSLAGQKHTRSILKNWRGERHRGNKSGVQFKQFSWGGRF